MRHIVQIIFFILTLWGWSDIARSQLSSRPGDIKTQDSSEKSEQFITLSTVRARPQAMGGAYTAILDGISSAIYNPAGLRLNKFPKRGRLTFFFNPVGAAVGLRNPQALKSDSTWRVSDAIAAAGLFIKSVALSWSAFEAILVLTESLPNSSHQPANRPFFNSDGILDRYSNTFATRLQLAEQISIGAAVTLYTLDGNQEKRHRYGSCYGILIQPNKSVNVGLAYFDFPETIAPIRTKLDRIVDETINLGISWRPHRSTLLSLDIRNVSEEQKFITREIHIGAELVPFKHIAFRGGYFRKQLDKENVFSVGVGILSMNLFTRSGERLKNQDWMLNYTFVYDDITGNYEFWHYFSFLLRI